MSSATRIRYYTWLDIEDVLIRLERHNQLPGWFLSADCYWDSININVSQGATAQASDWLKAIFEPRIEDIGSASDLRFVLESVDDSLRYLPCIIIEHNEHNEDEPIAKLKPSFKRGDVRQRSSYSRTLQTLSDDVPSLIVFHSFKGGTGRTVLALASALRLTEQGNRVLLIDADLEAPGITWLSESRFPDPQISYADFLALVHSDPDLDARTAIEITSSKLKDMNVDGIYVLPSFRTKEQFSSLDIRPEDVLTSPKNNFRLAELLVSLGKSLDVTHIIVDLRAGISEMSAGLLLDPRTHKIVVSNITGQSIEGTSLLLDAVAQFASNFDEYVPPLVALTQVTPNFQDSKAMSDATNYLTASFDKYPLADTEMYARFHVFPFNGALSALSSRWREAILQIHAAELPQQMPDLLAFLPDPQRDLKSLPPVRSIEEERSKLANFAERLIHAETSAGSEFLSTTALRNLASDHKNELPNVVVVGAKGAGKTYTFLQALRSKTWKTFGERTGIRSMEVDAVICPILAPVSLENEELRNLEAVRLNVSKDLGFANAFDSLRLKDLIRNRIDEGHSNESAWRDYWLDIIAWGVGHEPGTVGAGKTLNATLNAKGRSVVVVMDGLEDLFQNFATSASQQLALRSLLQDVPTWIQIHPNRNLGSLIFVRRDIVLASVIQNSGQLLSKYGPYTLRWNREEALRLALWVFSRSQATMAEDSSKFSEEELAAKLVPLWGKKLGQENSREGRSSDWVLAALSDLRGQIQARDLVRFLHQAAKASAGDSNWTDRVLAPPAIRNAIENCSLEKISEIEQENVPLKDIFKRIRSKPVSDRQIPFSGIELGLSAEDLRTLVDNGVIIQSEEKYYMSEIYRRGLGFSYTQGARPRVLALARAASSR